MKITRENFKNIVRETMIEESEYQEFFKKSLEKAGKSIPKMSDDEKKAFFNNIDKTWKSKGEKNERFGRGRGSRPTFGSSHEESPSSEFDHVDEAQSAAQKAAFHKMLDKKSGGDSKEGDKEEVDEVNESFADPLEGFPKEYKELLKKLQRSNDASVRKQLIIKMNVIRKTIKLKPLTNESIVGMKFVVLYKTKAGKTAIYRMHTNQKDAGFKHLKAVEKKGGEGFVVKIADTVNLRLITQKDFDTAKTKLALKESIVEAAPKMKKDKRVIALSKIVQELGSIERAPHEASKGQGPVGVQGKKTIVKIAKLIGDLSSLIKTGR